MGQPLHCVTDGWVRAIVVLLNTSTTEPTSLDKHRGVMKLFTSQQKAGSRAGRSTQFFYWSKILQYRNTTANNSRRLQLFFRISWDHIYHIIYHYKQHQKTHTAYVLLPFFVIMFSSLISYEGLYIMPNYCEGIVIACVSCCDRWSK